MVREAIPPVDKIKLQPLAQPSQQSSLSGWRLVVLAILAFALPGIGIGMALIAVGFGKLGKGVPHATRNRGIAYIALGVLLVIGTGALLLSR